MKTSVLSTATLLAALAVAGCATPPVQILDSMQPTAVNTTLQRGRFELNCPGAQEAALLSRKLMQPAIETLRFHGIQRGSFTIGISGCGQRKTYQIICP